MQSICDARYYKPSAVSGFEPACSVAKPAFFRVDDDRRACRHIERRDVHDGLADLLAVGADVLNRSRSDRARNSRQTFYSGEVPRHGKFNYVVPLISGSDREQAGLGGFILYLDARDCIAYNQAGKPLI